MIYINNRSKDYLPMHVKHIKVSWWNRELVLEPKAWSAFLAKQLATWPLWPWSPALQTGDFVRTARQCPLCYDEVNNQTNEPDQSIKPEQQLYVLQHLCINLEYWLKARRFMKKESVYNHYEEQRIWVRESKPSVLSPQWDSLATSTPTPGENLLSR